MDGDVFTRKVRRVWKRLASALATRSDPHVCAILLEAALAAELRSSGGLLALGMGPDPRLGGEVGKADIAAALRRKWQVEVVERVAPVLIGRGVFNGYGDVMDFVTQIDAGARFDSLAGSILSRPDGVGLRKPTRRRQNLPTLLREPAPLGDRA